LKLNNKRGGGLHIALVRRNDEHFINEPQGVGRFIYAMTSVSIPMPHQTPLV